MPSMMRVAREFRFEAAHRLRGYKGSDEPVHGHSWRLRVTLAAPVGDDGLAYDFVDLARIVNERVVSLLDHTDLSGRFEQPSTERIAEWIWSRLADLPLFEVRLWEGPDQWVAYRGEAAGRTHG
jgi:6-pyruvoyltetrahydropterin/6-carboxytetrahydropterin synthase